ncbi:Uncharacterised protein [Campylobacter ureolyticus]|uniref:Uncharacterized protein n=1 Tax=Campylobacter ureolyticus TaxID=827 RepID=A0A6N2SP94_9BACT
MNAFDRTKFIKERALPTVEIIKGIFRDESSLA